jgi:hypothetical protein
MYNISDFYFKKRSSLFVTQPIQNESKKREADIKKYDFCKNKLLIKATPTTTISGVQSLTGDDSLQKQNLKPSINLNQIVYNSDTILIYGFISISAIITSTYFYFYRKR